LHRFFSFSGALPIGILPKGDVHRTENLQFVGDTPPKIELLVPYLGDQIPRKYQYNNDLSGI